MTVKTCACIVLAGTHAEVRSTDSQQAAGKIEVMASRQRGDARQDDDFLGASSANLSTNNEMQISDAKKTLSISRNPLPANELRGSACREDGDNTREKCPRTNGREIFLRWWRFNLVGGIGIVVQLAALFVLKSVFHFNYLASTAVAVEAAVVHNFVWHERFTWADRVRVIKNRSEAGRRTSGAKTQSHQRALFAALQGRATQKLRGPSLRRFLRFNVTAGGVSIAGNLALMKVMVSFCHIHYFAANAIAIVLCSVVNFLVSNGWVFKKPVTSGQ